jgi:hypothetical protein
MSFLRNKKGQVHLFILVLVALGLVIASLFAFYTFNRNLGVHSQETSKMMLEIGFGQDYVLESAKLIVLEMNKSKADLSAEFKEIAALHDIQLEPTSNFFGKVRNGEFEFGSKGEGYELNVTGLFVKASEGVNSVTRNFTLCMEFNAEGDFAKNC